MNIRRVSAVAAVLGVCSAAAWYCQAQYQVEADVYRVRVINEMGRPISVKIIAHARDTIYHVDLPVSGSDIHDLYSGQRALCVWDDRSGELLLVAGVNIDRSGRLRIRPPYTGAMGAQGDTAARAGKPGGKASGVPSLQMEKE